MSRIQFAARTATKRLFARAGFEIRRVSSPNQLAGIGDMGWLLRHLHERGLDVSRALDVGASRGDWAKAAREVFGCPVTMIEPLEEMGPYLKNVAGCEWIRAGAGAEHGQLELAVFDSLVGSSFANTATGAPMRTVEVVPLESVVDHADLIKVDAQGFEMEVLRGAGDLLGTTEVWIIETSLHRFSKSRPLTGDIIAFMRDHGYVVFDVAGYLRRPRNGDLAQIDVCFARSGGLLDSDDGW